MEVQSYSPSKSLQPFVKRYVVVECAASKVNTVLPDTCVALAFRFKGKTSYGATNPLPVSVISGLRRSARLIHYAERSGTIVVLFYEAGVSAFFNVAVNDLFEKSISLDNLIDHRTLNAIEEQLAEAKGHAQRILILENFLKSRLLNYTPDALVLHAVQKIKASSGIITIGALADSLCISQDAFEKRFRKSIGSSPKQFARIVRLRSVVNKGARLSITTLSLDAGYFDQSHFSKDFKVFTRQSPRDFFSAPSFW